MLASRLDAQVIETPIAFDSAGRVRSITPGAAMRLALVAPLWPVQGDFVAARLYAASTGGHVLVVERPSGALERYALAGAEADVLHNMINAALARTGAFVADEHSEMISQPARNTFVRNQVILSVGLYGPLLAALANDAKTGTVLYLLGAGGSYFAVTGLSRNIRVTRAQNHLATDGALRGFAAANGLLTAFAGDVPDGKTVAGVGLAGALAGSIGGFQYGRRLTDAEAHATTSASSFAALTALGLLGATGAFESTVSERDVAASMVATGAVGYLAGRSYPRRARYTVTAGDVDILWVGAALGAAAAVTPFVGSDANEQAAFGAATAGMLGGMVLAERGWSRPYDHTTSDVGQIWLGTIAGGLVGAALVVLTEPGEKMATGMVTVGAAAGALAAHSLVGPAPAGARRARRETSGASRARAHIEFAPVNLALTAANVRGVHPLLKVRF